MDFSLPQELRMLRDMVARFVREERIPLEPLVSVRDLLKNGQPETW
jgi:hypothetical protein